MNYFRYLGCDWTDGKATVSRSNSRNTLIAMSYILLMQVVGFALTDDYALACDDALYDSDYYTTFGTLYEVKVTDATI